MIFWARREDVALEILASSAKTEQRTSGVHGSIDKKCQTLCGFLTAYSHRPLPRKVMVVCYLAESKGVVGCHYMRHLAFKVRDL